MCNLKKETYLKKFRLTHAIWKNGHRNDNPLSTSMPAFLRLITMLAMWDRISITESLAP